LSAENAVKTLIIHFLITCRNSLQHTAN